MTAVRLVLPGLPADPAAHRKATIRSVDGRLAMTIPIADPETEYDDLGQEWATIDRHPQGPVTYRRGPKLARATLRMRMIARDPNETIEHEVAALQAVANSVTPVVITYGQSMGRMTRSGAWVITNARVTVLELVQGTNDARWAEAELALLEAADWDSRRYMQHAAPVAAARTTVAGARTAATYTWKAGDDLFSVALRIYGDAARWRELGDANGIRDPRSIPPGRVLTLP